MKIERKRWVIMRKNRTEIFCGLLKSYQFKKVGEIGNTAIKTYFSKSKALTSFERSWFESDFEIEAVETTEIYEISD